MTLTLPGPTQIHLADDDLGLDDFDLLQEQGRQHGLAVDLETTGLDARLATIQVVSIAVPGTVVVTSVNSPRPARIGSLLGDESILKIFHHALFDMSFLRAQWVLRVSNVLCTKVAARLAGVSLNPHLAELVSRYTGVDLDKALQKSDWRQRPLTSRQVEYAAHDVMYLHTVVRELLRELSNTGRTQLYTSAMGFLPARVELELLGLADVFAYQLGGSLI